MNLFRLGAPMVLGLAMLGLMGYIPFHHAHAIPYGSKVVAGSVRFSGDQGHLIVTQDSKYAVIEWNSFCVGHWEIVIFNTKGPTLNRVVTREASRLDGYFIANHPLYLVNRNGVVQMRGGVVEMDHFFPTRIDIDTKKFMAGNIDTVTSPSLTTRSENNVYLSGTIRSNDKGVLGNIFAH